jgi:histidinol-phosphate aminotransferase
MNPQARSLVQALVREDVRTAAAYHVQDAQGLVRLDQMESPFAWPPELRDQLAERLASAQINRYPDPRALGVQQRLRAAFGIPERWSLMLGNGSDEIIQIMAEALSGPGARVMAPSPTFVMFRVLAGWARMPYDDVPLAADFSLDADAMCAAIAEHRPRIVFLACPNNPTGNLFSAASLERVITTASDALVVIDEAYWAFSSRDHLDWLDRHPNLVIMRTLSKLGLAGLRLGFLVGDPAWIGEFDKVRLPYNVGVLHQAAAEVALENFGVLREQTRVIASERARLAAIVGTDTRLHLWPGEANFLLVRVLHGSAKQVHAAMVRQGVLVKCLDGGHPRLAGCLRLGVGTAEENALMLAALDAGLREAAA